MIKNTLNNITKKHLLIGGISLVLFIMVCNTIITNISLNKAKKELLKANNRDDVILIQQIKEYKSQNKILTEIINKKQEELKNINLKTLCTQTQLNRYIEGIEYNLIYCEDKDNLAKFSTGL